MLELGATSPERGSAFGQHEGEGDMATGERIR
uniref:Uncharacterized protein n=1 Tax=Arundo donax TaxID=35708 RepID=A0A0A9AU81_ARUDO